MTRCAGGKVGSEREQEREDAKVGERREEDLGSHRKETERKSTRTRLRIPDSLARNPGMDDVKRERDLSVRFEERVREERDERERETGDERRGERSVMQATCTQASVYTHAPSLSFASLAEPQLRVL